ncbi:MAG: hypothetical protein IKH75_01205 [Ruminococcus sp.]|nr:hypothetical protein [Ruminococcus sp.]
MAEKHFGKSNLISLIAWIRKQLSKKLDSVTNHDRTIEVTDRRNVSVRISQAEGNRIQNKDGVYMSSAPVPNKLIIGEQEFDGSEEVEVDADGLIDQKVATDNEVEEMIDEVFGDTETVQTNAG